MLHADYATIRSLRARFVGPTWGPPGADRTQVGPMLAPWTLLSGVGMLTLIFNTLRLNATNIYWLTGSPLIKVMVFHLYDMKLLPEPMLTFCYWDGYCSIHRQTETSTTKTSTNRNGDKPKRRQTKTATNQNGDTLKLRHNSYDVLYVINTHVLT